MSGEGVCVWVYLVGAALGSGGGGGEREREGGRLERGQLAASVAVAVAGAALGARLPGGEGQLWAADSD